MFNDKLGPLSYTGVMSTFAYRILLPYAKLSFGLQAGFKNNGISWSEIMSYDLADPSLIYTIKKKVVPDASVGIYYYNDNFYAGISSRQLLQVEAAVVKDTAGRSQFTRLLRHFYFVTGSAVPVSENLVFRPSLLLKYIKNAPPQLDLSASFLYQGTFGLGISYRSGTAMTMYAELGITENVRIGYSYDMWLNALKVYNKGSHELQISFDFDYKKRIRTPRYF
jgi:type IX secretion system PorP/SprF family membrane protein